MIDTEAVPLLKRCSLAGHAELKTRNPIFAEHTVAADMFIDVLTDRGFSVAHVVDEQIVPVRIYPLPSNLNGRKVVPQAEYGGAGLHLDQTPCWPLWRALQRS